MQLKYYLAIKYFITWFISIFTSAQTLFHVKIKGIVSFRLYIQQNYSFAYKCTVILDSSNEAASSFSILLSVLRFVLISIDRKETVDIN